MLVFPECQATFPQFPAPQLPEGDYGSCFLPLPFPVPPGSHLTLLSSWGTVMGVMDPYLRRSDA
jgi:hypothetical protein